MLLVKEVGFKEKLIDLENNSVSRLGLSFLTIFN